MSSASSPNQVMTTLCFLVDDTRVLLAMKKRGFGVGKWNGTGGKGKNNENIQQTAIRETREEIEVTLKQLEEVATLTFHFAEEVDKFGKMERCVVFLSKRWEGEPSETEEMKPRWFEKSKLPFGNMWDDDPYWLPLVLTGKKVDGQFWFDRDFRMINHKIRVVRKLTLKG